MDVPIEKSIELIEKHPSVVERYFTQRYVLDEDSGNDVCVLFHSNKICVVTLAESHSIVREKKTVKCVSYKVSEKLDRMNNKVTGKGKHGAQFVDENAVLCSVTCTDGTEYPVRACVRGKLIEVNEALLNNPLLVVEKPSTDGYIAVVLQRLGDRDKVNFNYTSRDEYLQKRHPSSCKICPE